MGTDSQPSGLRNLLRAAAGALPFIPRSDELPDRTIRVEGLEIDRSNVAQYAAVTGLRYGDDVPLTYPFTLTFPVVMSLVTGFDFPFAAMGAVHLENDITQYKPISVTDTVDVKTHAENLREHRKGLLVDVVTDVLVGTEPAWHQVTTFLHQQRTSLSDEPKPEPVKHPEHHAGPDPPVCVGRRRSQPDPHHPDRCQTVRLPDRDRARDVQRRRRSGEHRGTAARCGALRGAVRQTGRATHQNGTLRRTGHQGVGAGPA